jgi:hypothetical protein
VHELFNLPGVVVSFLTRLFKVTAPPLPLSDELLVVCIESEQQVITLLSHCIDHFLGKFVFFSLVFNGRLHILFEVSEKRVDLSELGLDICSEPIEQGCHLVFNVSRALFELEGVILLR